MHSQITEALINLNNLNPEIRNHAETILSTYSKQVELLSFFINIIKNGFLIPGIAALYLNKYLNTKYRSENLLFILFNVSDCWKMQKLKACFRMPF